MQTFMQTFMRVGPRRRPLRLSGYGFRSLFMPSLLLGSEKYPFIMINRHLDQEA